MAPDWKTTTPSPIRDGLERFCQQLQVVLAGKLISIVLYGGLAKGEFTAGKSDVNVMVVLQEITVETLDQIAPVLDEARRSFQLNLLMVTEADLADSTEVFPIKFLDIQRHHSVLAGRDVASGLHVPRDRLRRQCARELMNLHLRLRQFYLERRQRPELIERTLQQALSTLLINLNVVLELKTGQPAHDKAAILQSAGRLGLDVNLLQQLGQLKRGEWRPSAPELKAFYNAVMRFVQQVVDLANAI